MLRLLDERLASNAYAVEIDAALPRIFALRDADPLSRTYGYGDRQFWGWKLVDFPNGTFQGIVNGLSTLLAADAFAPTIDPSRIKSFISSMLSATPKLMRRDGSFEEALPFEQSYCVTALALYDHLCAVERVDPELATQHSIELAPAARFLIRRDETHGFISNHLATAAAALLRWEKVHGDHEARRKAEALISRILERQSAEGWFDEYGGADPGYQTLCMTHLADAAHILDSTRLWNALEKGIDFLCHFAQPDGSFGGIYGSRATRIYYPGAMERLADRFESARRLADWMRPSIRNQKTVTLSAIDAPNLPPVFNNYCDALMARDAADPAAPVSPAPLGRRIMPEAGIVADIGATHHTIVSTRKSVVAHWKDGLHVHNDCGLVVADRDGNISTSQGSLASKVTVDGDTIVIGGELTARSMPLPSPVSFLALRLLALTIMRIPAAGAMVKQAIAKLLVGARGKRVGHFRRSIKLGPAIEIRDEWDPTTLVRVDPEGPFSVIHMASSGYWQLGDTKGTST